MYQNAKDDPKLLELTGAALDELDLKKSPRKSPAAGTGLYVLEYRL